MNTLYLQIQALQLQIQLVTAQLTAARAEMTPVQIADFPESDWTSYDTATRVIPLVGDEVAPN